MELQMDLILFLMMELGWVHQMVPLKDLNMEILLVHLFGSHWDYKTELHWNMQIELRM